MLSLQRKLMYVLNLLYILHRCDLSTMSRTGMKRSQPSITVTWATLTSTGKKALIDASKVFNHSLLMSLS